MTSLPARVTTVVVLWVAAAWVLTYLGNPLRPLYFETDRGKLLRISVCGIVMTLNTDSRVWIQCTRTFRRAGILRGEASFRVQHDPSRPFSVLADDSEIRDVGTIFAVRLEQGPDREITVVSVIEGLIELSALGSSKSDDPSPVVDHTSVCKGERGTVIHRKSAPATVLLQPEKMTSGRLAHTLSWEQGRVYFENDTISTIIREFNRYNTTRIRLADPSVGSIRLTGSFGATDLHAFMMWLQGQQGLKYSKDPDGTIVLFGGVNRRPIDLQPSVPLH